MAVHMVLVHGVGVRLPVPHMKIFSGRANNPLASEIASCLGTTLGKIQLYNFSDGELRVAFEENIRNEDVFIIQSTNPPSSNVLELLFMLDAARRASANRVIAVVPYFGYARQDRKDEPRFQFQQECCLI